LQVKPCQHHLGSEQKKERRTVIDWESELFEKMNAVVDHLRERPPNLDNDVLFQVAVDQVVTSITRLGWVIEKRIKPEGGDNEP